MQMPYFFYYQTRKTHLRQDKEEMQADAIGKAREVLLRKSKGRGGGPKRAPRTEC